MDLIDAVGLQLRAAVTDEAGAIVVREFLPAIAAVTSEAEAERVIAHFVERVLHSAGRPITSSLGEAAVAAREAQRLIEELLSDRVSASALANLVLALEALRRVGVELAPREAGRGEVPWPAGQFVAQQIVAIGLRVAAVAYGPDRQFVDAMARRAFETAQALRRAVRAFKIDATPWLDLPAEERVARLSASADRFWRSLSPDQRLDVERAWKKRTNLSPKNLRS